MIKYYVFKLGDVIIYEFDSSSSANEFLEEAKWEKEETVVIVGFRQN